MSSHWCSTHINVLSTGVLSRWQNQQTQYAHQISAARCSQYTLSPYIRCRPIFPDLCTPISAANPWFLGDQAPRNMELTRPGLELSLLPIHAERLAGVSPRSGRSILRYQKKFVYGPGGRVWFFPLPALLLRTFRPIPWSGVPTFDPRWSVGVRSKAPKSWHEKHRYILPCPLDYILPTALESNGYEVISILKNKVSIICICILHIQ